MRNDVFSRSPFGRKAYAHGLHFEPALDRSPLEPPLPPDSPILARWSAVRNCLPPLAELLDVEIVLMSAGYCVGGTGTHRAEGGNVAVVEQVVAFTDDRRMELLMKAEKAS